MSPVDLLVSQVVWGDSGTSDGKATHVGRPAAADAAAKQLLWQQSISQV